MDARERLITSMQALLWERGYVGTSPKDVQERAQAGQGSMYHHFTGKPDLARAAVQRTAEELRALSDANLSQPGTALERIAANLTRKRDVLRGCRIGRLTQDPDVVASPELRRPVDEAFAWIQGRMAELVTEAQADGDLDAALDPRAVAATLVAVLQGGYVLARAAASEEPYQRAVQGALALLRSAKPHRRRGGKGSRAVPPAGRRKV